MKHWKLGYHGNRKCNKVDNEVGKIVLRVEARQYEPKWEWNKSVTGNGNKSNCIDSWVSESKQN